VHPLSSSPDSHHGRLRQRQRRRRVSSWASSRCNEDRHGAPLWARPGSCWTSCSGRSDSSAKDAFVVNTIKCRPLTTATSPNEIDPPGYLHSQIELIDPTVILPLGNFATKLLPATRPASPGSTARRGQGDRQPRGSGCTPPPLYHPAAALYTPTTLEALRADFTGFRRCARGAPAHPEPVEELWRARRHPDPRSRRRRACEPRRNRCSSSVLLADALDEELVRTMRALLEVVPRTHRYESTALMLRSVASGLVQRGLHGVV